MSIYTHTHIHTKTHKQVHIHIHTYIHTTYTYTCTQQHTQIHIHTHIHAHPYTPTHTQTYLYTYTHSHAHTPHTRISSYTTPHIPHKPTFLTQADVTHTDTKIHPTHRNTHEHNRHPPSGIQNNRHPSSFVVFFIVFFLFYDNLYGKKSDEKRTHTNFWSMPIPSHLIEELRAVFNSYVDENLSSDEIWNNIEQVSYFDEALDITGTSNFEKNGRIHVELCYHSFTSPEKISICNPCGDDINNPLIEQYSIAPYNLRSFL